jgi:hypothetical protein
MSTIQKLFMVHPAAPPGPKHGSKVTLMDGAVFLRVCQIGLGVGRHPLEGCRRASVVQKMPPMR